MSERNVKRQKGKWRFAVVAVMAIGAAAWVALFLLVNPETVREELTESLHRATGRDVAITGGVSLRFGLTPSFTADGVMIANPDGASRPAMLAIKQIAASFSLASLMTGSPSVGSMTLIEPDLLLENLADGTPNWKFIEARRPLTAPSHGLVAVRVPAMPLPLTAVDIEGGKIGYRLADGRIVTLMLSDARLTAEGFDAPLSLSLHGAVGPENFAATGSFGALGRLTARPLRGVAGPWPIDLSVTGADFSASVQGGMARPEQGKGLDLRLTLDADDATSLAAALGQTAPVALKKLHIDTRIAEGNDGSLHTEQASVSAGPSDLSAAILGLSLDKATLSAPGPGQSASLTVEGAYRGDKLELVATAMQPDVLAATQPLPVSLEAAAAGARFSAHGTLPPSLSMGGTDVMISADIPDLSALSGFSPVGLPALKNIKFGAHATDAGFKLTGTVLRDMSLQSDAGNLTGELTLDWSPAWAARGKIAGNHIVLDRLLAANNAVAGPAAPADQPAPFEAQQAATDNADANGESNGPARVFADTPLNFAALRGVELDLDASLDDASLHGASLQGIVAHINLKDGLLAINPLRASTAQGALIGALTVDAAAATPHVALTLRAPSLSAANLAAMLGFPGGADGAVQLDAKLNGSGATPRQLAATLTGHAGLSLVDGQLSDTVIQALMTDALAARGLPAINTGNGDTGDKDTNLRCFAGRVDFAGGLGTVATLALDQARLSLTGTGTIDFGSETLALHLQPLLRLGPTMVAAPMQLNGPLLAPKIALDPAADNGRVGITLSGPQNMPANPCTDDLKIARDGLTGPMPAAAPAVAPPATGLAKPIKKPIDLLRALQGLIH
jgi:AsmA protein